MSDYHLVDRLVDAGELEVSGTEVVEDHEGVGLPAAERLVHGDLGGQLVVDALVGVRVPDGDCILRGGNGCDLEHAGLDGECSRVDGEALQSAVVEVRTP